VVQRELELATPEYCTHLSWKLQCTARKEEEKKDKIRENEIKERKKERKRKTYKDGRMSLKQRKYMELVRRVRKKGTEIKRKNRKARHIGKKNNKETKGKEEKKCPKESDE
jgi:hypothetical protein